MENDSPMKALVGRLTLIGAIAGFTLVISLRADGAEVKPAWQTTWEKTLAAAKKEGKLNFYVGRYGTEPLLNEFRKEFPEIQLITVNGTLETAWERGLLLNCAPANQLRIFSVEARTLITKYFIKVRRWIRLNQP